MHEDYQNNSPNVILDESVFNLFNVYASNLRILALLIREYYTSNGSNKIKGEFHLWGSHTNKKEWSENKIKKKNEKSNQINKLKSKRRDK